MAALVLPPVSQPSEIIAQAVQENKTSGAVFIFFPLCCTEEAKERWTKGGGGYNYINKQQSIQRFLCFVLFLFFLQILSLGAYVEA